MRIRALSFVLFVLALFSVPGLAGHAPAVEFEAATPPSEAVTAAWLRAC